MISKFTSVEVEGNISKFKFDVILSNNNNL